MKLSISNIAWSAEQDIQVYSQLNASGFDGLEIAPTRIFPENPYDQLADARCWSRQLLTDYALKICSMQSIWYGRSESIFASKAERDTLLDYTKNAICFASAIQCKNLVFGCPKNRNLLHDHDGETAIAFFREIGDFAAEFGTVIAMEANPIIYGTNYINDTASAIALIKSVASPGFRLNLDVGTMIYNEEDIAVLKNNVEYIHHTHISEPYLKPLQKRRLHYALKDLLQKENYSGYVSIEMGKTELSNVLDSIAYIKEVFQ